MRGLTRYATNLVRALDARRDVELVIISKERPAKAHVVGLDAEIHVLPSTRESTWTSVTLPKALRDVRADVFHAVADRGLPLVKVCPLVITVHGSYERAHWRSCFPGVKAKAWYGIHSATTWFGADRVITVSETTAGELLRAHVARAGQLRVTHLAAAPEFSVEPSVGDDTVLAAHGVRRPYVLFVGGYDRHKNVETLVEAFSLLARPDHQLVIVADYQWRYEELHQRWRELADFERLRCIQVPANDLSAIYRQAEVTVVPSRWESFGLQLLEAMASGTPVLASDLPALREVGGEALVTFDPRSSAELAEVLRRVLDDKALRASLRARGLRRAAAFSWERTADRTVQVYREAIGDPRSSRRV
jgi:glycosyltransferase involved in cell wall biosynthesis